MISKNMFNKTCSKWIQRGNNLHYNNSVRQSHQLTIETSSYQCNVNSGNITQNTQTQLKKVQFLNWSYRVFGTSTYSIVDYKSKRLKYQHEDNSRGNLFMSPS